MNLDAIQLVSKAIAAALQGAFEAAGIAGGVYVGPLNDVGDQEQPAAVLFLYRMAVNADLRNAEHRLPAADPTRTPIVYEGGLPLDLYYLLTGGTAQTGDLESLRVLGCAMQTLNQQPVFVGQPVGGEPVRLSLEPVTTEEMSRIWSLFPTVNYRTSVAYLASPVWIDPPLQRPAGSPVIEEPHRVGHFEPEAAS